jgi:zinc protease
VPVERKLASGLTLLVSTNHTLPLVAAELVIETGADGDPAGKAGLATLVARMLDAGTRTRTSLQIAEGFEGLAARFFANAGRDSTRVHLNCLTETLPDALALFADVVTSPAFRPADLERVRAAVRNDLAQKHDFPRALATDEINKLLFGADHPWGQVATVKTVAGLARADLVRFHETWFRPNNAVLVIAGDIEPEAAARLVEQKLGAWKPRPLPAAQVPPPKGKAAAVAFVPAANASQSQVYFGAALPLEAADAPAIPLLVANVPLGGIFSSRLNLNLREAHGYSYGAFSQLGFLKRGSLLMASGGIVAKETGPAIVEMRKEVARFAEGGITDAELAQAKIAIIRSLPSQLETDDAVAASLGTNVLLRRPLDYFRTLPARVEAITLDEANAAIHRFVDPRAWSIAIAGPESARPAVEALGIGTVVIDHPED